MARDIFEQLADWQVPPPPEKLDDQVHERVNRQLVILHMVDLALRGLPWAMWHFGRAMLAALVLTVTGKWLPAGRNSDTDRKLPPTGSGPTDSDPNGPQKNL